MSENKNSNLEELKDKIKNATLVRHSVGSDFYYIFDNGTLIAKLDGGDLVHMLMPSADYVFSLDLEGNLGEPEYDF